MLTLLHLPPQQDRDAVMVLHMGGTFEGKSQTLDRFRKNYRTLAPSIKARLVLENDDVSWSVHDLLPICEELDIPLVLDYHHHNIIFDASKCREGTLDISQPDIMARIAATWTRKGIKQKMHYSEPCPGAVTLRDRRKHSPRVATLPPCPNDIDLMIEAKDKEQAVLELMRNFKLPGFERIGDMIPHERADQSPAVRKVAGRTSAVAGKENRKGKRKRAPEEDENGEGDRDAAMAGEGNSGFEDQTKQTDEPLGDGTVAGSVGEDDFGMGGNDGRVYWPPGRADWLKPAARVPKNGGVSVNGRAKGKGKARMEEEEDSDDSY